MISVIKGDITGLDFDLIVNDARQDLMPQNGISAALFEKAGPDLIEECRRLKCDPGQVVLTHPHALPCKGVIHAVGPVYIDGSQMEAEILEACYWNAMALAYRLTRETGWTSLSIAFPCLGIQNGYPKQEACHLAIKTIKSLFSEYPDASFIDVVFVCEDQEAYQCYKEELNK